MIDYLIFRIWGSVNFIAGSARSHRLRPVEGFGIEDRPRQREIKSFDPGARSSDHKVLPISEVSASITDRFRLR